eukprot:1177795-Prorocentrum_minimum.AAC.5
MPLDVIAIITNLYPGKDVHDRPMYTRLPNGLTEDIPILRGTIQGDSLISPLLFILYIEPLLRWLKQRNRGYKHVGNAVSTEAPTYADDLALVTSNARDLRIQTQKLQYYSDWARIKVNVSKCAITRRKYVGGIEQQIEKTHYKNITYKHPEKGTHTFPFPFLPTNETYRHIMGVHICLTLDWKHNNEDLTKAIKNKIEKLNESLANTTQRIEIISCKSDVESRICGSFRSTGS